MYGHGVQSSISCNIRQPVEFTALFFPGSGMTPLNKPERCFFDDSEIARRPSGVASATEAA